MTKLTKSDILRVYQKIKQLAVKSYGKEDYNNSIKYISIAARVAVYFNWIYSDEELECLTNKLSKSILTDHWGKNIPGTKGRYVFYDFRAVDNVCLTQQYLRALIATDAEILYIPEVWNPAKAQSIISELSAYPKITIIKPTPGLNYTEKIKQLFKEICDFAPEKIFLQLAPWSAFAVTLFNAFPGITKYYIDLNDHSFNLGTSCTDYTIEFRHRGCTVAMEKRQIPENKILYLPYYPIISQREFAGFPKSVTKDKVILLSGGSFYKIYGDNDTYFKIVKRLVQENSNLLIIYVGIGYDTKFKQFIKDNKLNDRIIILNFRKDINEVFQHCDIYLATYPFGGGLMCQYAAVNGKPVLAYNRPEKKSDFIESVICDQTDIKITYTNLDELAAEAKKLIHDENYRYQKGLLLKNAILTPEQFNKRFQSLLIAGHNEFPYSKIDIDYDAFFDKYLERQNGRSKTFKTLILSKFKWWALFLFPKIVYVSLPLLIPFLKSPKIILRKLKESTIVD